MKALSLLLACACLLLAGGCYTTRSGLPEHIHTVKVPVFKNKTEYYGLESKLTRAIIAKLNVDPAVRVVNESQDATISGEIVDVEKRVLRDSLNEEPREIQLIVTVKLFFRDEVEGKMIIDGVTFRSQRSSSGAGQYDLGKGETRADAEVSATSELADEIVRSTIGMW